MKTISELKKEIAELGEDIIPTSYELKAVLIQTESILEIIDKERELWLNSTDELDLNDFVKEIKQKIKGEK